MATTLNKVRSGDPLVIPAATYNAFVDVARDHRERQRSATKDGAPDWRQTGIVLVRNDSGADRERFDVLGVSGPVITPTDNADAFKERVAIKGVTPTTAHAGRFVVLLEPAKAGLFGRGCVDGVCVARVKMNDEGHVFAEAKDGQADKLDSGAAGSACLLWVQPPSDRDPDPTVAWALIRVGLRGGGGELALVQVRQDGGAAGDLVTPCSWTYSLYPPETADVSTATPLAEHCVPARARTAVGRYRAAADGTWGLATRHPLTGAWLLLLACDEVEAVTACDDGGAP